MLEKGKEIVNKIPALAALSAAAVGIYAVAKKFLPKSITESVNEND
jgi:hypothetical protein